MKTMVSIIVPTYNRENVIERALRSILRQTYSAYEVIVVDDGSTDGTESVVARLQDDRIRYIALQENQGVAHARNVGIQEAKYDYVAFLDSDDEWLPNKLELQMKKMLSSSKRTGMVYCRMGGLLRDGSGRFVCPHEDYVKEILEGELFKPLLFQNVIGTPTMLVRKECLQQTGGFKETLHCLEDWELILRIAKNWKIAFVDKVLVEVHKSEGSVSTNTPWYLIARCYMVSLYRQEITELGMMDQVKKEILDVAVKNNLYEEINELLNRDIEL
ncbi:MAG: glycosyltransferase family 2 protein [Lachnospiraceae bacterium]|nr:glycosyltransferase family 2 protein [Lachnospiraceae bacterium]